MNKITEKEEPRESHWSSSEESLPPPLPPSRKYHALSSEEEEDGAPRNVTGVIFDLGGVLITESPLRAFAKLSKLHLLLYILWFGNDPRNLRERFLSMLHEMEKEDLLPSSEELNPDVFEDARSEDDEDENTSIEGSSENAPIPHLPVTEPILPPLPELPSSSSSSSSLTATPPIISTYKSTVLPQIMLDWMQDKTTCADILDRIRRHLSNWYSHQHGLLAYVEKVLLMDIATMTFRPGDLADVMVLEDSGVKLLRFLKERLNAGAEQTPVKFFLLTNFNSKAFEAIQCKYPHIFELFDDIIVSGDVSYIKPEKDIFELAIRKFKLDPAQAVFIDDSPENIQVAEQEMGIRGVLFGGNIRTVLRELIVKGVL